MDIKVLAWNVKHFKGPDGREGSAARAKRVARVAKLVREVDPDIFAILEVVGDASPYAFAEAMPEWSFLLTEGQQTQEILVGYKPHLRVFFTQKGEFRENNLYLRPAPSLDVRTDSGRTLSVLFTHFKSLPNPPGWGLRTSMFEKVGELKKSLDTYARARGEPSAAFITMGDFNTMGLKLRDADQDISAAQELIRCDKRLARRGMVRPPKSHGATYHAGSWSDLPDSDLDHVWVDDSLTLVPEDGHLVQVGGWVHADSQAKRDTWVTSYSDHAPIWVTLTDL